MNIAADAGPSPAAATSSVAETFRRSHLAAWRAVENAADRYASYGALGVGVVALAMTLVVL